MTGKNSQNSNSELHLEVNHNSPVPLHVQVEELLRKLIQQEEYKNGKLLPAEKDLAKKLNISRNTFRAAMNKLVYEGLVVRRKGIGTHVNQDVVRTQLTAWPSFTREMNDKGRPFHDIGKRVSRVPVSKEVAQFLGIEPNVEVQKLERLRGESDEPVVLFISYFHPRVGITPNESFEGPLYEILEEKYHVAPTLAKEEIVAELPDEDLAAQLMMEPNTPVLIRKHLACDDDENPIEFCYACYRADRFVYQINFRRDDTRK